MEKGSAIDEYGRFEPMDYIVDEEQFHLETLGSHTQYLAQLPLNNKKETEAIQMEKEIKPSNNVTMRESSVKQTYTHYFVQGKVKFFMLVFERYPRAAAAAKQFGYPRSYT